MRTGALFLPPLAAVGTFDCPWIMLRKPGGSWLTFGAPEAAVASPLRGLPAAAGDPTPEVADCCCVGHAGGGVPAAAGDVPGRCGRGIDGAAITAPRTARRPPTSIGAVLARISAAARSTAASSGARAEAAEAADIAAARYGEPSATAGGREE